MNSDIRTSLATGALCLASVVGAQPAAGGGTSPRSAQIGIRYHDEIFASYQRVANVKYGQVSTTNLYLDIYTGTGDTLRNRPLGIFIHAGGFQSGDKTSLYAPIVCGGLSRRGYVAASINYRLTSSISGNEAYFEAMLRALQDAKAAVRFFRKNGALYGVDTSQIFAIGSSAGAITALHLGYLDSAEVPGYVNWDSVGNSFEGASGNPGYSSHVQGVISNWGAIGDTAWIKKGDVPVYCVHGTADSTIYYNIVPAYGPFLYSSKYIIMTAQQKGITNGLRLFIGAGHELNGDTVKLDSAVNDFSAWLYTILKPTATSVRAANAQMPERALLLQNYPNPFNPGTTITYNLPRSRVVRLSVYDILGREVATLVNERKEAGTYEVKFEASGLSSGVYFCRLSTGDAVHARRLLLVK